MSVSYFFMMTYNGTGFPCNNQAANNVLNHWWKTVTGKMTKNEEIDKMGPSLDKKLFVYMHRYSCQTMRTKGHADWAVYNSKTKTGHTRTHSSSDREVATPVDNSIDHTVRALHSHPGPWEEAKTVQIYTTSKESERRRRRKFGRLGEKNTRINVYFLFIELTRLIGIAAHT